MSLWSVKDLEIKLGNAPEKSPALPELIKSGYGRGERNAGVIAVTSPDSASPVRPRGVCHSGVVYLEGRQGKVILVFIDSLTLALLIRIYSI